MNTHAEAKHHVSPDQLVGRGLKPIAPPLDQLPTKGIARSIGRARIETRRRAIARLHERRIARSIGRARIETIKF